MQLAQRQIVNAKLSQLIIWVEINKKQFAWQAAKKM